MALYFNGNKVVGSDGTCSADKVSLDDTNLTYEANDAQEAFEKITKSLTYEDYEALTDAEKNNGTIYLITDVNGDGQSFQPVIYSEEEREIGVWVDGRPVYEKTFKLDNTSIDTSHETEIADLTTINVETFVGVVNSVGYFRVYDVTVNENRLTIGYKPTSKKLIAGQSYTQQYTAVDIITTIRYTKTTDTAGSGTWTPQGVPAIHYSEDEQVVGTWIDGSTIYEKTFNLQSEISLDTSNWTSLGVSLSGVDTPISTEARSSRAINSSVVVDIFDSPMTAKGLDKVKSLTIRYTKSST